MDREKLEARLTELPLMHYAFLKPEKIPFSPRLQEVCRQECPMYGASWSCPPAVGTVDECRQRCLAYDGALLLMTAQEVADAANLAETLAARPFHTSVVQQAEQLVREQGCETLCLSADACALCGRCAWPEQCRQPEKMTPC